MYLIFQWRKAAMAILLLKKFNFEQNKMDGAVGWIIGSPGEQL